MVTLDASSFFIALDLMCNYVRSSENRFCKKELTGRTGIEDRLENTSGP